MPDATPCLFEPDPAWIDADCRVPGCHRSRRYPGSLYCPRHSQQAAKGSIHVPRLACAVCAGPMPADVRSERLTCSDPCKQLRGNLRRFGLTPQAYRDLYDRQQGRCAGCLRESPLFNTDGHRRLYIDHCHRTGSVRGLLCSDCNLALGKLRDDPETFDRLAEYLRAHQRHPEESA